jgi:Ser/Thr protein kinase RdoA (MazF antagonist)
MSDLPFDPSPSAPGSAAAAPAPYAGLTPDRVLDALAAVGILGDGRLLALNSYENRVYQIYLEEGPPVVAKFYRPGRWTDDQILEEHVFTTELSERELPVVAPLSIADATLHEFAGYRFAVYPRRGGRAPEFERRDTLEWMGRFIARIHAIGATRPFAVRPTLDIASFGEHPREWLLAHGLLPGDLVDAWSAITALALDGVRRCFDRAGTPTLLRLHGDCHAGNVLWTDDGPHFVDFDDSRSGPAVQDLWMLLAGERDERAQQLAELLAGYEDFFHFDRRQLHLIEALRTLRLIHYSAWLARRFDDPAFPAAFPWFNTPRYWQERILELREQLALMDEPPLWASVGGPG